MNSLQITPKEAAIDAYNEAMAWEAAAVSRRDWLSYEKAKREVKRCEKLVFNTK